jgi:hypothetical protein
LAEGFVNSSHPTHTNRILRTAAWLYVAPRAAIGFLILATLGVAALLVFLQIAFAVLRRLGG